MNTRRHKTDFVWWSRLLAGAVILFPYSLSKIDFRSSISVGVNISAHKASPAYAAFEDLTENFDSEESPSSFNIPNNGIRLAAGEGVDIRAITSHPAERVIALKGMTIRGAPAAEPAEVRVAAQPLIIKQTRMAALSAPAQLTDNSGNLLPLRERAQNLVAQLKDEDWSLPSPAQLAHELIEQQYSGATVIQSRTGTPIIISKPGAASPVHEPSANDLLVANKEAEDRFIASLAAVTPDPGNDRPLWLNGQVEMTGGLAFTGPETHLEVKRLYNGAIQERGRVWISEGRFEIRVKRPVGYLVAELITREGRVLGRGEMNLVNLTEVPVKAARVDDIRLALRPTTDGAAFRTVSGYSHGQQEIPVADSRVEIQNYMEPQKVNDEGFVADSSLDRDSTFVARAVAPKHWASVVVGQANHPQNIRLFSNGLVEALVGLELNGMDRKEASQMSIVWGQIMRDGQPVEGATVEMAGAYTPIYFNEMYLPDKNMKKSGPNGLFAFLRVKSGVQALRVRSGARMYPAQVFPTEDRHVSYVELQLRDKMVSQFRVFDVLDFNKQVSAHVRMVGTDEMLPVSGHQLVEYAMAADPFMVEAEAGPEYEISRTTLTGQPHLVQVPLIRRDWLAKIYNDTGVLSNPTRGIVAGFIDDQDYEIEMTGYAPGEHMQIVYFDGEGRLTNARTGSAGGGFMIFNAPPGLQTVYIHPTQSRETYSQVVVAEPRYVHVMTWAQHSQQ
jgi:hypothetical protein